MTNTSPRTRRQRKGDRMLTRRGWLKGTLLGGTALLYGKSVRAQESVDEYVPPPSPAVTPFQARLPIPRLNLPLNRPDATPGERARAYAIYQQALGEGRFQHAETSPDDAADYYEIVARPALRQIIPGLTTPVWGYNGHYPGATFLARRNRPVIVRLVNRVPEITSLHYHGGHTPPDSDGTPMLSFSSADTFAAGALAGSRTYVYPNDNEFPATQWYHDHGLHVTASNVYMGLAGLYLLTPGDGSADEEFRAVDAALPSGYGRYDIPMVFQDRRFHADGALLYNSFDHDGFIGDRFLVNGAIQPYMPVARRKYRFRWLNGSNARYYELFLSSGDKLIQIGSDGALLQQPVERASIRIAPSERMEVIIDFSRYPLGSKLYLSNCLMQTDGRGPDALAYGECTPLVEFRVHRDEEDPSSVPQDLNPALTTYIREYLDPTNPHTPGADIPIRDIRLERGSGAWQINGQFFDPNRVDIVEKLDGQSILRLTNLSGGWQHPIHIHDMEFLILDRNGVPPPPAERGLKDTINVGENETVRVMACWTGMKNVGQYVFHCHNLEHEDMSMMGIIEVVP